MLANNFFIYKFTMNDSLTTILLINSLLIIILITTQNETKDSASAQSNTTTATSPLEFLTWGAVFCELIFLLLKIKLDQI